MREPLNSIQNQGPIASSVGANRAVPDPAASLSLGAARFPGLRSSGPPALCAPGARSAADRSRARIVGSASWHASVGFVELPDWLTRNHRYRCVQYNARLGLVPDLFSARRRAATLGEQVASMREERSEDPEAHVPFRGLQTDGQRIDEALDRQLSEESDAPPPYGFPTNA